MKKFWTRFTSGFTPFVAVAYLLVLISGVALLANRVSPGDFWPAGFLAPLAPFFYLVTAGLFFLLLIKSPVHAVVPLLVVLLGMPLIPKTYQWNNNPAASTSLSIRVLSYNVSFFSIPTVFSKAYRDPQQNLTVTNTINWLQSNQADIQCLQEFWEDEDSDIYRTVAALTDSGTYDHYFVYKDQQKNRTRRGLIILSKFPIVERGKIFTSENYYNGAIYADILVDRDTIRIINTHLESMQLGKLQKNVMRTLGAYRSGLVTHSRQVQQLTAFVRRSPHPVILCGDLNETPYGYVYRQLNNLMHSAFKTAGQGFGFTYQGDRLFFLRIDNQFFTDPLEVVRYKTHQDLPFSKHLPVEAAYEL